MRNYQKKAVSAIAAKPFRLRVHGLTGRDTAAIVLSLSIGAVSLLLFFYLKGNTL